MRWFGPVEAQIDVDTSPEATFAVIADPTTYPDWLVGAQRIRSVDPAFPAPGSEFHHSVGPTKAATIDDTTEVTSVEARFRLGLEVHAGPFVGQVELEVRSRPGGSEVRFTERPLGVWSVLTPLLRPVISTRNAQSLRQLADHLDDRA